MHTRAFVFYLLVYISHANNLTVDTFVPIIALVYGVPLRGRSLINNILKERTAGKYVTVDLLNANRNRNTCDCGIQKCTGLNGNNSVWNNNFSKTFAVSKGEKRNCFKLGW